jgi:hypothetical protein
MIKTIAIGAVACLWTTAAYCQTTDSSAFCGSASLREGASDAEVAAVWQRCKKGDTIAISAGAQGAAAQIGRLCDFTRPVVNVGAQIICVLGSERGVR